MFLQRRYRATWKRAAGGASWERSQGTQSHSQAAHLSHFLANMIVKVCQIFIAWSDHTDTSSNSSVTTPTVCVTQINIKELCQHWVSCQVKMAIGINFTQHLSQDHVWTFWKQSWVTGHLEDPYSAFGWIPGEEKTQHRTGTHSCHRCQCVFASHWECRMDDVVVVKKEDASPARGQSPGGVCCRTKDRNSYSACCSEILLSFTALVRPDCKKEPSHKSETLLSQTLPGMLQFSSKCLTLQWKVNPLSGLFHRYLLNSASQFSGAPPAFTLPRDLLLGK